MTEHSTIGVGGSTCARVIACPPSRLTVREVAPPSPDAQLGTQLHDFMERWLTGQEPELPEELAEEQWKVDQAMAAWREIAPENARYSVEQRVHLKQIAGAFGTVDVLLEHDDNRVTILDWKFGQGVQVFADTKQLLFYGAAAMTDPATEHLFNHETAVELAIVQPNDRDLPVLRRRVTDTVELWDFVRELRWAVDNGHRDELLKTGDHCRWCPMKAVCPKLLEEATAATQWEDPHDMEPEQIAELLERADKLEQWIKAVRGYAQERLANGKPVPGFKLVAKRGRKQWIDEQEAARWFTENQLIAKVTDIKLKSVAQANKLVDVPETLYETRSSGTTIAPDSDSRPAVASPDQFRALGQQIKALSMRK